MNPLNEQEMFQVVRPIVQSLAKSAARKWIASRLRKSNRPHTLGPTGLKAVIERECPKHYVPATVFAGLLSAAGLMRGDIVFATEAK